MRASPELEGSGAGCRPERTTAERCDRVSEAADGFVALALRGRADHGLTIFELPEALLLAALNLAATIDGTRDGTLDWLETVVARLRTESEER